MRGQPRLLDDLVSCPLSELGSFFTAWEQPDASHSELANGYRLAALSHLHHNQVNRAHVYAQLAVSASIEAAADRYEES